MATNGNKLKLTDRVDVQILQKIQDDFAKAMNMTCRITDLQINPLTKPSHTNHLCHGLIRKTKKGEQRCKKSHKECGQKAKKITGPALHTCHAELTDFAAPIEMDGKIVAYIFGGHVLTEVHDSQTYHLKAEAIAKEFGLDLNACLEALKERPILSNDRIEAAARMMQTVAHTISDMADETKKARKLADDWTNSLHQIGLSLVSDLKLPQVLENIAQSALNILNADVVLLYQYNARENNFDLPPITAGKIWSPNVMQTRVYKEDLVARLIRRGESHYSSDAEEDPFLFGPWGTTVPAREGQPERSRFPLREGIKSSAGVLLKVVGEVVGIMYVNFRKPQRFPKSQRLRIDTFAYQAAIAIYNARLFEKTQKHVVQLEKQNKIKESIDTALSLDEILQTTLEEGLNIIGTNEGSIMLVEPITRELEIKAWLVKGKYITDKTHRKLTLDEDSIAGHVAITGSAYNCPDASKDGHFAKSQERQNISSLLSVPIISSGHVLGIINTDSVIPDFFKEDDIKLLSDLANHLAVVIESQKLRDIWRDLSTLTVKEMLVKILESACFFTGTEAGTIRIVDAKSGKLLQEAEVHPPSRKAEIGHAREGGLTWQVIESGKPIIIPDVQSDPRVKRYVKDMGVKALMRVPVQVWRTHDDRHDIRTIGALSVNTTYERKFSERDVNLLQSLANQAAIAITNAELLELTKSDLDRQVAELNALAEIDDSITSASLDAVLKKILSTATQIINFDDGALHLMDASGDYLEKKAHYGTPWKPGAPDKFQIGKLGVSGWVAEKKRTARIANVHSEEWEDIYVETNPETNSELDVPLLDKGDQLVGLISLQSSKLNAFSEGDQRLMEALARQAVIAINNQKRYNILGAINEVGKAISSTLDLNKVLPLILERGLDLVGAPTGNIMLYDKGNNNLWMVHGRGIIPGRMGRRQKIGDGIVGLAARDRKPYRIADVTEEPWRDIYIKSIEGTKSELAVPMLYKDKDQIILVGVLNAECPRKGDFSEDDEKLFEALADQAVIAIRNAELHQSVIDKAKALETLHEICQNISLSLDFTELSQSIVSGALKLINADTARVYLHDGNKFTSSLNEADSKPNWIPKDQGLAAYVVKSREPVLIDNIESLESPGEVVKTEGIRSFICYPLVMGTKEVGVLYVNYNKPHSFTEDEIEVIGTFASHASIAIKNVEHKWALEVAQTRFQQLYEAAQEIIKAKLDEQSILLAALRYVKERTGVIAAAARLLDESGKRLLPTTRIGKEYSGSSQPIAVGVGVNGWVAMHRKKLLVYVDSMPDGIGTWSGHPETKQKLVFPMLVGDDYFGNIGFDCGGERLLKEDEIPLLEGIVTQAAAALQRLKQKQRADETELRKIAMDQLTVLHTLRSHLLHGFGARHLTPLREMADGIKAELEKPINQINREIIDGMLNSMSKAAQDNLNELKKIVELPTKEILVKAILVDINIQIQGAYRYTLKDKPQKVNVEFSLTEDLPKKKIDPLQLSLIYENLFINAYKAFKDWDGVCSITVSTFKTTIDADGGTKIVSSFKNTGPTLQEEVTQRLFNAPIGKGMGLYTSRWLLGLYRGEISLAENAPGCVTFLVEFNLKGEQ